MPKWIAIKYRKMNHLKKQLPRSRKFEKGDVKKVCREIIIHYADGKERVCEDQKDLMSAMPNGLVFEKPYDYAFWSLHCQGFYVSRGVLHPPQYVPTSDPPDDTTLIDEWGYEPDTCLCPVDFKRTAEINGYICSFKDPTGEYDGFDNHFYEKGVAIP